MELSVGVLKDITQGKEPQSPIVQILGIKAMEKKVDQTDRYRVLLSDSQYQHSSCMLVTQLNHMVENQDIVASSVIRMDKYICNCIDKMANRYVIIILEATVIKKRCAKLGNPTHLVTALQSNGAASSPVKPEHDQAQKRPTTSSAVSTASKLPRSNVLMNPGGSAELPSFTIDRLNPYQNKWTIKVRVTNKCPVRRWSNTRGEGRLFSFDVIDNTGEMRVTAFNDECDKFFDVIEQNKVYLISRGKIKPANRQYSGLQNDYEMTLGFDSTVEPCNEHDETLPKTSFNFIQLKEVLNKENNEIIDVVAIANSASELQTLIAKSSNREIQKRNVSLVDETATISCAFWGSQAAQFDATEPKVVALKGVRVSDFNGRSLSVLNSTLVAENPDIPERSMLMSWFERKGGQIDQLPDLSAGGGGMGQSTDSDRNYNSLKHLCDMTVDPSLDEGQAEYANVKAVIVGSRKENALYQSCPTPDCNKKVHDLGDGTYRCEKCDRATTDFKWRYILQVNIADFTDNQWVTFFNEQSTQIVGTSAEKLGELLLNAASEYDDTLLAINFTEHLFRLRSKLETFNDERRTRITCMNVYPLNYSEYGNQLLSELKKR